MSRYQHGSAISRNTEIGTMIENFLDNYSESISQFLWDEMEALAEEVDNAVEELETQLAEYEEGNE